MGRMRVLIVEDDFICRKVLVAMLSGYELDIAVNGQEALQAFSIAQEEKRPYDLICLDIMMPEINGQDVLHSIRQTEAKAGIEREAATKILMTSALSDRSNVLRALKNQCDGYLLKPYKKDKLIAELRKLSLAGG